MNGRTVGRYMLQTMVSAGPWGVVYEAEHPALGRVALQVLEPRFARSPEQVKRFRAGGEALSGLQHEALQRVFEVGRDGNHHFIARELLAGEPISRLLAERGPFEYLEAFRITCRIAGALDAAHRAGLRHGAVRPANIVIDPARDRAILTGFLLELPEMTPDSGLAAETSWYVAPEELRWGQPGDVRADIYALALVTFEMCAGRNPFRGELGDMIRRKLATPPSLCALRPDIPPTADQILQHALAPDPAQRTQSAAELADALYRSFLAPPAPPVNAHPEPDLATRLHRQAAPAGPYRNITPNPGSVRAVTPAPAAAGPMHKPTPSPSAAGVRKPTPFPPTVQAVAAPPRPAPRPPEILCMSCEKPVHDPDPICPHCGITRAAPPCPRCGAPVTSAKNRRIFYPQENGYYPWHASWDGRCECCAFEFSTRVHVDPGHYGLLGQGGQPTEIEIRPGESVYTSCDSWEYQPTIEIRVKRMLASNTGTGDARLTNEGHIALTPAEWSAISRALAGPLRVLLERVRWTRDTT